MRTKNPHRSHSRNRRRHNPMIDTAYKLARAAGLVHTSHTFCGGRFNFAVSSADRRTNLNFVAYKSGLRLVSAAGSPETATMIESTFVSILGHTPRAFILVDQKETT